MPEFWKYQQSMQCDVYSAI